MLTVAAKLTCSLAKVAIVASMLAGSLVAQAADRAAIGDVDQAIGALAYAPQTKALYKSDGKALYRSENDGGKWTEVPVTSSANDGRITVVAVSGGGPGALYVAGSGIGVLKSADAGKSWSSIDQGLPSRDVIAFATHSTLPDTLYAVIAGQSIYRSEDGGGRWRMVDKGPQAQIRDLTHSDLEGSMQTGWLFAATDQGIYRSMDCFCGWRRAGNLPHAFSAVAYNPKQPMQLYAAAGRQVFITENGSEEWQTAGSLRGDVRALAYSPSGVLYALLDDGRVMQSTDKGRQWE